MAKLKSDQNASKLRVLVVEDHPLLRTHICSMLRKKREIQQIFEASDGVDAVQKAQELQPDLILLDIGLPTLNGIKAAQRIRELSSRSRVLFVTQESSDVIVEGALQ